jgi:dTDP-4-amino-4,6-dideoxygalactose transaminase
MINVFGSCVGAEELAEIKISLDNQWLGMGAKVKLLEEMLADKLAVKDFTLIDNCSNGLYMALDILDLPKHSEVIVPANTWVSCGNAVLLAGYKPVFADVDYDTCNVTHKSIDDVTTDNTKAVMVVHYAGLPAIIKSHLPIVSDAAHAVDSTYNDMSIPYYSTVTVFSFDSMKNIACGELGGITAIPKYQGKTKTQRYCGIVKSGLMACTDKTRWWEYDLGNPFIKMLPNDITASIGIAQLRKLDKLQAVRKHIWDSYQEQLKEVTWLKLPPEIPKNVKHSYFTYFIKVINGKRDELARHLLNKGIYTTVRYEPLHLYKAFGSRQKLATAELLNEQLLNLPLHPNLTNDQLHYIIDTIKAFNG